MRIGAPEALLVALGVLAMSCGSGDTRGPSPASEQSASEETTSSQPSAVDEVEAYLVEMSNLAADIEDQLGEFECSYNEEFFPGSCGVEFVEEGEEVEPPPEPTEDEQFAYQQGLWRGMFEMRVAHADVLDAIAPPHGFETAHDAYVASYRSYFTYLRDLVAGFADLDELIGFFDAVFDPLAQLSPNHERLLLALVDSCRSLEELGDDAGYRTDLGCPSPPPEPVSIQVEIGDGWSANPDPLPVGDGLVLMTITNRGPRDIRPVVLHIFDGDPLDLPVNDGVVDLSRDGVHDPASGYAAFGLAYAGHDEVFIDESGVRGQPPLLLPGASVEAAVWSSETMVVFDYEPGEFEAGAYVVVERSGSP